MCEEKCQDKRGGVEMGLLRKNSFGLIMGITCNTKKIGLLSDMGLSCPTLQNW